MIFISKKDKCFRHRVYHTKDMSLGLVCEVCITYHRTRKNIAKNFRQKVGIEPLIEMLKSVSKVSIYER